MTDEERIAKANERYAYALHGIQSGVSMEMELGGRETEPKHLRVGINSAMVGTAAMAKLLMAKGLFTLPEYLEALADQAEEERKEYEQRLSAVFGTQVTLG